MSEKAPAPTHPELTPSLAERQASLYKLDTEKNGYDQRLAEINANKPKTKAAREKWQVGQYAAEGEAIVAAKLMENSFDRNMEGLDLNSASELYHELSERTDGMDYAPIMSKIMDRVGQASEDLAEKNEWTPEQKEAVEKQILNLMTTGELENIKDKDPDVEVALGEIDRFRFKSKLDTEKEVTKEDIAAAEAEVTTVAKEKDDEARKAIVDDKERYVEGSEINEGNFVLKSLRKLLKSRSKDTSKAKSAPLVGTLKPVKKPPIYKKPEPGTPAA